MKHRKVLGVLAGSLILAAGCVSSDDSGRRAQSADHQDLVQLFHDWREFQKPPLADGVADYSAEAMAEQRRALQGYRDRLKSIDASSWPLSQQVDYHLVRAEMNGLDFDHRVLRPWRNNPAFYIQIFPARSDVPAHEGPVADGFIDLWKYSYPLSDEDDARLVGELQTVPVVLERARVNLTGNQKDLWAAAVRNFEGQIADLDVLAERLAGSGAELSSAIRTARDASESFAGWLREQAPTKTGPSGVGIDNYNWYLKNVHLVPFTWRDEVTIMRRELARAHSTLRLEENRNRGLPPLERIADRDEYEERMRAAVSEYMAFLSEQEIVPIRDYMPGALMAQIGAFSHADGLRNFFSEVDYREPLVMRNHHYHWFDLARMEQEPHASPMRQVPLLYNIFDSRAEGLATAMEEMMMHAGLFQGRPRARELVWIMLAQRAARALAGLRMHSNEFTLEQATQFASEWTPRGWMPAESDLVFFEQHLYLQQPEYGSSYISGKVLLERLLAERARQLGEDFTLKGFFDELNGCGVIPVSLIHWELTGDDSDMRQLLAP